MALSNPRYKILPLRGTYTALNAEVANITEGEICYATDEDQYYQKEGGVLVSVGATKAQGALADSSVQPGDNISDLTNDAGYITLAEAGVTQITAGTGVSLDPVGGTGVVEISASVSDVGSTYITDTQTAAGGVATFSGLQKNGTLVRVTSSLDAWVVLYSSAAERTADAGRAFATDPASGSGVLAEFYITAGATVLATPGTTYFNSETPTSSAIYAAVRDQAGVSVNSEVTIGAYAFASVASGGIAPGDNVSALTNDAGYITLAEVPADAVTSVNGQTGVVSLGLEDLDNVVATAISGDLLRYNGTNWVNYADSAYATSAQGTLADSAVQPGDNISTLTNDAGYITSAGVPGTTDDLTEGTTNLYSQWDNATGGINYAGGSVGIGTPSPARALDVRGTTTVMSATSSTADVYLGLFNSTSAGGFIGYESSDMNFWTGGTERMRIDSSGNVGIGLTPSGDSKLQVIGSMRFGGSGTATDSTNPIIYRASGVDDLVFASGNTERMRVDSSGRLLIGVGSSYANSGADDLQVGNNSSSTVTGISLGSTVESSIRFADASDASAGIIEYAHATDSMQLYTSGSERMRIDSNGNVGIGESSPSHLLDVKYQATRYFQVQYGKLYSHYDDNNLIDTLTLRNTGCAANGHGSRIHFIVGSASASNSSFISAQQESSAGNTNLTFGTNDTERMRIDSSGVVTIGGNTAWHAGNDGSGSGLDADLLDGIDSSSFLRSDASDNYTGSQLQFTGTGVSTMHHGSQGWQVSGSDAAYQRVDARDDATNYARMHWYGVSDTGSTSNFRHAWYDGGSYFNITANSGAINFERGGGQLQMNGNTVWHAGNDGPGSGLDADTLDGIDSSSFLRSDVADNYTTLVVNGSTNGASFTSLGSWGTVHNTSHGYIQFGPANTSHAHIYTDRPSFYFNAPLQRSGNTVWDSGNDGSGSGLDADLLDGQHGSYYLDYNNFTNKPSIPTAAGDLSDVVTNNQPLTEGDVLAYSSTSSDWRATTLPTIPTVINDLSNVNTGTPPDGSFLQYVTSAGEWQTGTGGGGAAAYANADQVDTYGFMKIGNPGITVTAGNLISGSDLIYSDVGGSADPFGACSGFWRAAGFGAGFGSVTLYYRVL